VESGHPCCTPRFSEPPHPVTRHTRAGSGDHAIEQCLIPAGVFWMGDALGDGKLADGERPVHQAELPAFSIDATTVTNADFARFVAETAYITEAESFGFSAVFHLVVAADEDGLLGRSPTAPWWLGVRGADWRHPEGPYSDIADRQDHPVVHVTWNDAQAYCRWTSRRLPTEVEWERASRGGLERARYPWGDELLTPDGGWRTNIWQGIFPVTNTRDDGWLTTAPARCYSPNKFGLWQTVGNVWEWCQDVFYPHTYAQRARAGQAVFNPRQVSGEGPRVLRGGSYLCHDSYCNRYRNAARASNTADSSMGNAGFRTVG
jgi:formylglycine-generating enzyme required for sulfatase activity